MKVDSIRKRYFFKFGVGIFKVLLGLLTASLVPRALGPTGYGNFGFLKAFFVNVMVILSLGTPTAFFNYNSRNHDSFMSSILYGGFLSIIFLVLIILISITQFFGFSQTLWPGIEIKFIYMGGLLGFFLLLTDIANDFMDAKGLTVRSEIFKFMNIVVMFLALLILYFSHNLNLQSYFVYLYGGSWLLITISVIFCVKIGAFGKAIDVTKEQGIKIVKYFYRYSAPLALYGLIGTGYAIFYRWFLQETAGAAEQGYFTLGYQFNAIILLVIGSFIPIFKREIAFVHEQEDLESVKRLFVRYSKLFFSIAAFLAIFLGLNSPFLIRIFAGEAYVPSTWPVTFMILYTVCQASGQFSTVMFYSTEQTRLYTRIGYVNNFISFLIIYFLLAPPEGWVGGLGLGANGLAIGMFITGMGTTNILYYVICRYLKIRYSDFFVHQLRMFLFLALLVLGFRSLLGILIHEDGILSQITSLTCNFVLYFLSVCAIVYFRPTLFGMNANDVEEAILKYKNRLGLGN